MAVDVTPSQSNIDQPTVSGSDSNIDQLTVSGSDMTDTDKPTSSEKSSDSGSQEKHKPFTDDECLTLTQSLFESCTNKVHSRYLCQQAFCSDISDSEKKRLSPKKFNHSKLTDYWWLSFVEGQGMYCILCKKHNLKHKLNKRDVFVTTPATRFLEDALKVHAASQMHKSAIETEMVQKLSIFHTEVCHKKNVESSLYEKVFSTVYFLMKNFVSNRKLLPLLDMIENVFEYENLRFFNHKSAGSQRDFFLLLGDTVKDSVIEKAHKAQAYGLLTDEVSDISVTEHLITFIQYFDQELGSVQTSFLSCQNIFEHYSSANAKAISDLLLESINTSGLDLGKFTGFSSDGASVMVGKKGGVATLLREKCPTLINVHCICHKLALSCTDSNEGIKYVKEVELVLRQLWNYFENSPKRMACYLKVQMELKGLNLSKGASKKVASRLKKACRTRWLSLDSSVTAVYNDYEALLQTLDLAKTEDAIALGLSKKIRNIKFLGVIYILRHILPVLSHLSRVFQSSSFNFSAIIPEVNSAKDKLDSILQEETPITALQSDIDSINNISAELSLNSKAMNEIQSLFKNYIAALKNNIDRRFTDTSEIITSFSIFDIQGIPNDTAQFKEYGNREIQILARHFYRGENGEELSDQLKTEWNGMKYHLRDILKPKFPHNSTSKMTSTERCLIQLLSVPIYKQFFPKLTFIAEVAASLPVTNAWPERGASSLKNIKTIHRNRVSNDMLEALLQVTINGPRCEDSGDIVKQAVSKWLSIKNRKKLAEPLSVKKKIGSATPSTSDTCVQTDPVMLLDQEELREEIKAAIKTFNLEDDSDSSSSASYSDSDSD